MEPADLIDLKWSVGIVAQKLGLLGTVEDPHESTPLLAHHSEVHIDLTTGAENKAQVIKQRRRTMKKFQYFQAKPNLIYIFPLNDFLNILTLVHIFVTLINSFTSSCTKPSLIMAALVLGSTSDAPAGISAAVPGSSPGPESHLSQFLPHTSCKQKLKKFTRY